MAEFLPPYIHLAALGPDLVLLDERNNAYFCLPRAAGSVAVDDGGLQFVDPDLRAAFAQAGFCASDAERRPTASAPRPRRDLGRTVAKHVALTDVALILVGWLSMFASYHGRPFGALLRLARRQRRLAPDDAPDAEVLRVTAAFERVLPWLPFQGVCLYRAFLLRRILYWRGYQTSWVFGVQTWPFHAHCWLQIGETALDDTADRLTAYQAILVV